jgi:hypothetical protein
MLHAVAPLSTHSSLKLLSGIGQGLTYLLSLGFLHKSLTSSCILVSDQLTAKV